MNAINILRRERNRSHRARRIKPAIAATKAEDLTDAIAIVQLEHERANHIVEAGAQTTAGHNAGPRLQRIEKKLRPRPGQLEPQSRPGPDFYPLGNAQLVTDGGGASGGEARLAERGDIHDECVLA